MPAERNRPKRECFNRSAKLPFQLRLEDFEIAMQDLYDLLTASIAKHSPALTQNEYFNGHPDLLVKGIYPNDAVKAGSEGVEIKTTRKVGGAVDTHGARNQWMAVFVYNIDTESEPARQRRPLSFSEVYLGQVTIEDFRRNPRGELGTRTATLHREGILKLRSNWIYKDPATPSTT